jgi:SAM-dependent methyltransferase
VGNRRGGDKEDANPIGLLTMALRTFTQNMLKLAPQNGISRAFLDFLEVAVAMNTTDRDVSFRSMLIRYDKQERYLMMETYTSLVLEMTGDGSGLIDVLGEFYSSYIGNVHHFTNQKYYDMLPGLLRSDGLSFRVADYHCRTGRRLLAAAKFNRNLRFFGVDPDIIMCRITLLNLCLNGLFGEVAWYDAQHDNFFDSWQVDLDYKGKPSIRKLDPQKSLLFQKRDGSIPVTSRLIFNF